MLLSTDEASCRVAARDGVALAAFVRPTDITLGPLTTPRERPADAGEWEARIVRIDHTPGGARVHTAEPAIVVDVAADVVASAGLAPGRAVRLRVAPGKVRFTVLEEDREAALR